MPPPFCLIIEFDLLIICFWLRARFRALLCGRSTDINFCIEYIPTYASFFPVNLGLKMSLIVQLIYRRPTDLNSTVLLFPALS
jgi:hypothetical protein